MAESIQIVAFEGGELRPLGAEVVPGEAVLALPLSRLVVKMVRVSDGEDAIEMASKKLAALSPFPDEPLTVSCETVRETEQDRVVLAAALPEGAADDIADALDAAKINVTRVDVLALGELRGLWPRLSDGSAGVRRLVLLKGADCISLFVLDDDQPSAVRAITSDGDLRREVMLSLLEAEDFGGAKPLDETVVVGDIDASEIESFAPVRRLEAGEDRIALALKGVEERTGEQSSLDVLPESWREVLEETRFKTKLKKFLAISGGVWAPCLTHADGLFWLVYTNARGVEGVYKDVPNYVVTAEDPCGPWSEPVFLNSSGFDPSLFHDDDGRKYVVNMLWDHRPGHRLFAGIVLQEYSPAEKRLVGPAKVVYTGTPALGTEGPHLYKRDGTYYLMVAEGGTAYWHGVQLARSKSIWGPYESDPQPLLTAKHDHGSPLQRTGHGCLVNTPKGDLFVAYLCGRPVPVGWQKPCPLCRETALVPVEWNADGWLRMKGVEGVVPPVEFDVDLPEAPVAPEPETDVFEGMARFSHRAGDVHGHFGAEPCGARRQLGDRLLHVQAHRGK